MVAYSRRDPRASEQSDRERVSLNMRSRVLIVTTNRADAQLIKDGLVSLRCGYIWVRTVPTAAILSNVERFTGGIVDINTGEVAMVLVDMLLQRGLPVVLIAPDGTPPPSHQSLVTIPTPVTPGARRSLECFRRQEI